MTIQIRQPILDYSRKPPLPVGFRLSLCDIILSTINICQYPMNERQSPLEENSEAIKKREPTVSQERLEKYRLFIGEAKLSKLDIIYYPCCGADATPSSAFPDRRVIYVDTNNDDIGTLQDAGMEAYCKSALDFEPEKNVDVLILLNQMIPVDRLVDHVAPKGYVLCNDYHRAATALKKPKFCLAGNNQKGWR